MEGKDLIFKYVMGLFCCADMDSEHSPGWRATWVINHEICRERCVGSFDESAICFHCVTYYAFAEILHIGSSIAS